MGSVTRQANFLLPERSDCGAEEGCPQEGAEQGCYRGSKKGAEKN